LSSNLEFNPLPLPYKYVRIQLSDKKGASIKVEGFLDPGQIIKEVIDMMEEEKKEGSCCEPKKEDSPSEPAAPVAPAEEEKKEGGCCCG